MKKILVFVLLLGALSLVACSGGSKSSDSASTSTTAKTNSNLVSMNADEKALNDLLPAGNQTCVPVRTDDSQKKWVIASAILDCKAEGTSSLSYGLFNNVTDLDDTYKSQATFMLKQVESTGGKVLTTTPGAQPCVQSPNESGEWGLKDGEGKGGKYTCVSVPKPRIVWTERSSLVIGDADLTSTSINDLVTWWTTKSGPK